MTRTDATKGKSHAGNPYMRFDEGCVYAGQNKSPILKQLLALGVLLSIAAVVHAETWYLKSSTDDKAWKGENAGQYWKKSSDGQDGSEALNPNDTYIVKDGLTLGAIHDFGGGNLWIGDLNTSGCLQMNAHTTHNNGFLKLASGYVKKAGNSASLNLASPTIVSPKKLPFGFMSEKNDNTLNITTTLIGENGVGIVVGGYYDGTGIQYMDKTNFTFGVDSNNEKGLSEYHGDIRIISNKPLISPTQGNIKFVLRPTDSDATVEIEGGAEFKVASVGEVKLSGLTLHTESLITIPYNSTSRTTGVIRVTDAFSIPESEGKVRLCFSTSSLPAATNDQPCAFPVLIVPDTQTIEAERFILSNEASVNVYEKPLFRVIEDAENGIKSLVAVFPGRDGLIEADSHVYTGGSGYAKLTSAFSEEKANQWFSGNTPHEFTIYEFGMNSKWGKGHSIRTPYLRNEDYVFPGLVLRTGGTSANFTLADNTKTTINLELMVDLSLRVVSGLKPTLDGTIHMGADVSSSACDGSELTIASTIIGNGNWEVRGAQKGKLPHCKIAFTSDNSEWKGSISLVRHNAPATTVADTQHLKMVVVNPAGLGGALDEFNYKALSLADCSEMIVTNSLELAKNLNRGLYVTNTATINVDADCDFVCNWPITFDGPLRKVGGGTLCLGGDAKFLDSACQPAVVPRSDVDCRLSVTNGAVKALRHDCLNGVTVELLENGCLALDFNPDDVQVRRYGFFNVNTDTPFPADGEINVRIDNPDYADLLASKENYKLGLLTVKTSAANALNLGSRIKFNKSRVVDGLLERVIREDDAVTKLTTYSAYYDFVGFRVIVR